MVIALVASALAITTALWPDARSWALKHGGIGWGIAILCLATTAWAVVAAINAADRLHQEADRRSEILAQTAASHEEAERRLLKQIADLERRLHPTRRDLDQFAEVLTLLPFNAGPLAFLDLGFNAKSWRGKQAEPLYDFAMRWESRFFDDEVVQLAFEALYRPIAELVHWMSANAAPVGRQLEDGDFTYAIAGGHEHVGGWEAVDRIRDEALDYVRDIFEQRQIFERVGRERGL